MLPLFFDLNRLPATFVARSVCSAANARPLLLQDHWFHRGNQVRKSGLQRRRQLHSDGDQRQWLGPKNLRQNLTVSTIPEDARCSLASKRGQGGLKHHKIYTAFFKGSLRQAIPRHLLDLVPVLKQIAGRLLLSWKIGLEAAGLASISVCNLEKDRLIARRDFGIGRQTVAHSIVPP
jgi:hypothetical protein